MTVKLTSPTNQELQGVIEPAKKIEARNASESAQTEIAEAVEACDRAHPHPIAQVKGALASDDDLQKTAELFKTLGDPSRLKIINALLLSEMCVCDLAELLEMGQSSISHHLKVLRLTRLVKYRREGKSVYYELDDIHVSNIFYQGLLHAKEQREGGE